MSGPPKPPAPLWRRLLPLVLVVGLCVFVFAMGWHHYLTLEHIAANRDQLKAYVTAHYAHALGIYFVVYVAVVALSLPGGALLTILGGFLFGWMVSGPLVILAATLGAVIIFMVARTALGETLGQKAGPWLGKLRDGFNENALSYLLFLRLVPAFPFWLVNLAPALLGVSPGIYTIGTFIGIIPGTLAFSFLGAGLDSIIAAQRAAYEACLASPVAGKSCAFTLDAGALLTPQLIAAFAALGIVAILPVAIRKIRDRGKEAT